MALASTFRWVLALACCLVVVFALGAQDKLTTEDQDKPTTIPYWVLICVPSGLNAAS